MFFCLGICIGLFILATFFKIYPRAMSGSSQVDKPEKITSGPFKGKFLMLPYDVRQFESELFGESVEAVVAKINKGTYSESSFESSLARSTIDRIEDELDPWCPCIPKYDDSYKYDKHRTSKHAEYIAARTAHETKGYLLSHTSEYEDIVADGKVITRINTNASYDCACDECSISAYRKAVSLGKRDKVKPKHYDSYIEDLFK